jgi:DNA-binding GntR family transcriptional regulator
MNLKQQTYATIRRRIISCEYYPYMILNEEKLREEFGVSRTPIRDALSRLEQESLVQILPKKGSVVTGISAADVAKLYEARFLTEPYAVKTYGGAIARDVFVVIEKFFAEGTESLPPEEVFTHDDDLHRMFMDATENPFLIHSSALLAAQNSRIRTLSGNFGEERLRSGQEEHRAILAACLAGDWERAGEAMRSHLERSLESALAIVHKLPFLFRRD